MRLYALIWLITLTQISSKSNPKLTLPVPAELNTLSFRDGVSSSATSLGLDPARVAHLTRKKMTIGQQQDIWTQSSALTQMLEKRDFEYLYRCLDHSYSFLVHESVRDTVHNSNIISTKTKAKTNLNSNSNTNTNSNTNSNTPILLTAEDLIVITLHKLSPALHAGYAHYLLGHCYEFGANAWPNVLPDIDRDSERALSHYVLSANLGNVHGKHAVAFAASTQIYAAGSETCSGDSESASASAYSSKGGLKWLEQNIFDLSSTTNTTTKSILDYYFSAIHGSDASQMVLGSRYLFGLSTPTDCETSLAFYESAANTVIDEMEQSPTAGKIDFPSHRHKILSDLTMTSAMKDKEEAGEDKMKHWEFLVSENDVHSALILGSLYLHGAMGVRQDLSFAVYYLEKAATLGSQEACGKLGMLYLLGPMVEAQEEEGNSPSTVYYDPVLAAKYLAMGAPAGKDCKKDRCDATALNGQALMVLWGISAKGTESTYLLYESEKSESKAKEGYQLVNKLLTMAGEFGSNDAYFHLGMISCGWMKGGHLASLDGKNLGDQGVLEELRDDNELPQYRDYENAMKYFSKAAANGHTPALHKLGTLYKRGLGVTRSCNSAARSFKKVAERGSTSSSLTLQAYTNWKAGNIEVAMMKYAHAAEMGIEVGQLNAAFLLEMGHCGVLDEAKCKALSLRFWKAAARQGNAEATLKVGDFHYYQVIEEEVIKMKMTRLGGEGGGEGRGGVVVNTKMILKKFAQWMLAMKNLGKENEGEREKEKETLTRAYEKAVEFYMKAVELHMPRAMFNLGWCYEWGIGVKKDFPLSKRYYDKAMEASKEASVPVRLALLGLSIHEKFAKLHNLLFGEGVWLDRAIKSKPASPLAAEIRPTPKSTPKPKPKKQKNSKMSNFEMGRLLVKHLLDMTGLLIVLIILMITTILQFRRSLLAKQRREHAHED